MKSSVIRFKKNWRSIGAVFSDLADEPGRLFLEHGYTQKSQIALPKAITDLRLVRIPWLVRKLVFGKLIAGYSVYHFTYGE